MPLRRLTALLVALGLLVGACGGDADDLPPEQLARGSADEEGNIDPALLEPLTGLGPCSDPPEGEEPGDVPGLILPPTSVVTEMSDGGPLAQINGYVERTPVEVRAFYAGEASGVEVLTIEDEIREAEVLVTDGERRLFVKAQAVCERGSVFVAFLAPEGEAERLPAPALGGN